MAQRLHSQPDRYFLRHGAVLEYETSDYNSSRLNERAVEIPVVRQFLRQQSGSARGLEVGNVLWHYGIEGHRVVDRHEEPGQGQTLENLDVFDITGTFDWIVAVSTVEHVRWDEEPRRPDGALGALAHLRSLLSLDGNMLVTVPTGYHPALDGAITSGSTGAWYSCTYSRNPAHLNRWRQDIVPTPLPYGVHSMWADAVWIGEFQPERIEARP